MTSKYFCMAPWTHLHTQPNGDVLTCCLAPNDQIVGNLNTNTIEEIWNSEQMKKLRRNIINDEISYDNCHRCYNKEAQGFSSLRSFFNNEYSTDPFSKKLLESTTADGEVSTLNLAFWDFRFSNLCNLKCRTCGPGLSSQWVSDFEKLYGTSFSDKSIISLAEEKNKSLIEAALQNIESVKSIHFAGGEPLIMNEHWILLDALAKANRFDVKIRYSTNLTKLSYRHMKATEYWKNFKSIYLAISLDDIGERFDYTRHGDKWINMQNNLNELKSLKMTGVQVAFHPTISIFNIFYIDELFKFIIENNFDNRDDVNFKFDLSYLINLNPLTFSSHYNMQILPNDIKYILKDKIDSTIAYVLAFNPSYSVEQLHQLKSFLFAAPPNRSLLSKFFDEMTRLDQIRGESFANVFPEFYQLIKKYNSSNTI